MVKIATQRRPTIMKKILLIALSSIILVPHVLFAMGAPGMPIAENPGAQALKEQAAESLAALAQKGKELLPVNQIGGPAERLSSLSCPTIPEKYRTPLALGALGVVGCWGVYQALQARSLAREKEETRKTELARQEADRQVRIQLKLDHVRAELKSLMQWNGFRLIGNGRGFDEWFKEQQMYITSIITYPPFFQQAIDKNGILAKRDQAASFGLQFLANDGHIYIYTIYLDTPKSAKFAYDAKQKQFPAAPSETSAKTISPLNENELKEMTQRLNPSLVLKLVRKVDNTAPTEFDDLLFTANLQSTEEPYIINNYEKSAPEVPKPGWFASWFTKSTTTPAPAITTIPAPIAGQVPTSSSSGIVATPPSEAATSGTSTQPTQPESTEEAASSAPTTPATPATTKRFWEFWK